MTKVELMNNVTRAFNRVTFKLKQHSPEILVVTGVVVTVGVVVVISVVVRVVVTLLISG